MTKPLITQANEFSRDFEFINKQPRNTILYKTMDFLTEEVEETRQAIDERDREAIIDGFGDVAFVAINGIYKEFRTSGDDHDDATWKTEEVMNRICRANNSKKAFDGSVVFKDGKVQKPLGWKAPQYEDLL